MDVAAGDPRELPPEPRDDRDWTCDEIERLYRQALDAMETVADDLNSAARSLEADETAGDGRLENDEAGQPQGGPATAGVQKGPVTSGPDDLPAGVTIVGEADPIPAWRVIEALLFVGRQPLTVKAICSTLRGEFDAEFVEHAIEQINRQYESQNRPYEICLGEGGYRIVLRAEYESLRNRVYGFGPRKVRLSQAALEVLAIVAYRQPISRRRIEESSQKNAGPHLRQLLERGLIVAEDPAETQPSETQPSEAAYRTTGRFLRLFGLTRLEDLPQIADLSFK
jgi:segregation and condensation protein B